MNHQSYYRIQDSAGCDLAVTDQYLLVNCAGACVLTRPFTTHRPHGRQDYYLLFMDQGTLDIIQAGRVRTIQPGHLVLFHPGEETWYVKNDERELIYYWVHFTGSGVATILDGCGLGASGIYCTGLRQEIAETFQAIFQNYISRDSCHEIAAAAQLVNIFVHIRRSLDELSSARSSQNAGRLSQSLGYIHRHYSQLIPIRELAAIEHLSTSRYCALFRRHTGVSPQNFIIDLRMRMAAELMMKTDLSVKQVAQMVGYDDPLYFSRLFRSKRGLSPRQYARTLP